MPPDPEEKYLNTTPSSSDDSHCNALLLRSTQDQVPVNSTSDDDPDFVIRSMLKRNQRTVFSIFKRCKSHEELLQSHKLCSNYVSVLKYDCNKHPQSILEKVKFTDTH